MTRKSVDGFVHQLSSIMLLLRHMPRDYRNQRSGKRVRFGGMMLTGGKPETFGEKPLLVTRPPQIPNERISYNEKEV